MEINKLDAYEQSISDSLDNDEWVSKGHLSDQKDIFRKIAKQSMAKTRRITLRVTEQDYELAHVKAIKAGIPYQTLISSILHRYLTGQLKEVG
jgi:predicted DNA binding CopG/RHH family protein